MLAVQTVAFVLLAVPAVLGIGSTILEEISS
jgi:hypothetical protein